MASPRNLGQIRTAVKRRMGSSPQLTDPTDYNQAIADIHRQVALAWQWSLRRREQIIAFVAPYTTGTVTVTKDASTVTGAGTVWTAAMVGRQATIAGEPTFFYVKAVAAADTLTLGDADGNAVTWGRASASAQSYSIFQSVYVLPANVNQILEPSELWPLTESSQQRFDAIDPERTARGRPSEWAFAQAGVVSAAMRRYLEVWPVPDAVYTVRLPYLVDPPELAVDADLPVCPSEILEWQAVIDLSYAVHAKTGDARWVRQAESAQRILYGDQKTGVIGVYWSAVGEDQARFGSPRAMGDATGVIGNDLLSSADWAARLG